jgi:hypothetical protein
MEKIEAEKFIGKAVANAVAGGVHYMDVVTILVAIQFSLLMQAHEANKQRIVKTSKMSGLLDGGGN